MSRLMLVVQEDTPRSFPLPPPMREALRVKLIKRLVELTHVRAKMNLTPAAETWYRAWYNNRDNHGTDDKMFSGYYERKPDHMMRLAMVLSISEDDGYVLERKHLEHALSILNWTETWLPAAFDQLSSTSLGEDHVRLLTQLKKAGGALKHSDWLRKNSSRMSAFHFKQHIQTMRESKLVDFDGTNYYLTPEGWKR